MKNLIVMAVNTVLTACSSQQSRETLSNRESARIHTELGAGYYQRSQMGVALDEFTEAISMNPNYALVYSCLPGSKR